MLCVPSVDIRMSLATGDGQTHHNQPTSLKLPGDRAPLLAFSSTNLSPNVSDHTCFEYFLVHLPNISTQFKDL